MNEDDIEFASGDKGIYAYTDRVDEGAMVVPMTNDGKIVVLHEWRYPIKDWTWCFPAGGTEEDGEDRLLVAKRELKEETGIIANNWEELGDLYIDPGANSQKIPIYLASDIEYGETCCEDGEVCEVHEFSIEKIEEMIKNNEITNGWFLACFAKLKVHLTSKK